MDTHWNIKDFKWPVSAERTIAAPASKVWDAISAPGNLVDCHPFCESNPVHTWPGKGSHDEVHYLSGWMYERRFVDWHEGIGYDLEIGRPGGEQSYVSWRVSPIDDQQCTLKITVCSHALQNWPGWIRWLPFRFRPLLLQYLESVVGGFDWYVTRGEAVPRDQFGPHPWFSAAESSVK